ncbi:tetratricopeptide repeat protein [Candidatus Peribacteria bacterium]|nr:tetratricopeptide repeat protein [Candidatus Peribacteria bacterium]
MKIPLRIVVPVAIALTMSSAAAALFLWQIRSSISIIESSFQSQGGTKNLLRNILPSRSRTPIDSVTVSEALMELRQGEIFELRGEWKQAQEHYERSVQHGGGAPALKKLASIELQRREYQSAKKTIRALSDINPKSTDTVLLLGLLALRSGDIRGATSVFSRTPNSPESQYGSALVAITQGDHETARKQLTLAVAGNDATVRTYAKMILTAYDEFALFPNGQDIHLLTLLSRSLAQVNECETALPLLQNVILKQERYRDAWIVKGYCEFISERLQDALTSLEEAYSLDPEKAETQYFLARTHAALGDPQNAVTFLQYALLNGFTPQHDARELLIRYAQELGNTELALEQLKILASLKDSDLQAFEHYVTLAITLPDHTTEALALAKKALVRWPNDASALALAARTSFATGNMDDAQRYVDSALRIDPKNAKALEMEGMMGKK